MGERTKFDALREFFQGAVLQLKQEAARGDGRAVELLAEIDHCTDFIFHDVKRFSTVMMMVSLIFSIDPEALLTALRGAATFKKMSDPSEVKFEVLAVGRTGEA